MHYLEETHLESLKRKYRDEVKERAIAKQDPTNKKKSSKQKNEVNLNFLLIYNLNFMFCGSQITFIRKVLR